MSGLINKAKKAQTPKTLKRAGDANRDPADLASRRDADAGLTSTGRLAQIPLDDLTPNPRNPRDEDLDTDPATAELAASMHQIGQQQPAVVVSRDVFLTRWPEDAERITTPWVLMIGSRRKAAAKKNGWATLECVTREHITPDLEQLGDLAFHENVHRKDLNPLRVAFYLADQKELLGTEEAVAAKVGKTQPWVNQMLKLLKLAPELQALVKTGELNAAVGRDLARLSRTKQHEVLESATALTTAQREKFWRSRAWTEPAAAPQPAITKPTETAADTPAKQPAKPAASNAVEGTGTAANGKTLPVRSDPDGSAHALRIRVDGSTVAELAAALVDKLDEAQLRELVDLLNDPAAITA